MQLGGTLLRRTAHACVGMKQRHVDSAALGTLLDYGLAEHPPEWSSMVFLYEHAGRWLERDLGDDTLKRLGNRLATYAVFLHDSAVGTVGRRFRRVCRYS